MTVRDGTALSCHHPRGVSVRPGLASLAAVGGLHADRHFVAVVLFVTAHRGAAQRFVLLGAAIVTGTPCCFVHDLHLWFIAITTLEGRSRQLLLCRRTTGWELSVGRGDADPKEEGQCSDDEAGGAREGLVQRRHGVLLVGTLWSCERISPELD